MDIYNVHQSSNISLQELMDYFGWPPSPPLPPIQLKRRFKLLLGVITFYLGVVIPMGLYLSTTNGPVSNNSVFGNITTVLVFDDYIFILITFFVWTAYRVITRIFRIRRVLKLLFRVIFAWECILFLTTVSISSIDIQGAKNHQAYTMLNSIFMSINVGLVIFIVVFFASFIYRLVTKLRSARAPQSANMTDQQYEDWVRSWQTAIRQFGMQKLGLSNSDVVGKPLYVRSIVWPDSHDAKFYRSYNAPLIIKYGLDGRAHASVNRYTFFYPTQHYIAVFTGDVNALGQMRFEGTRTYFYDDIVGVETSAMTFNDGYTTYAMQHFELRVSSGQSISATTYVHDLDVDQTVQALRTLLRDKKYGIRGGNYGSNP